MRQIFLRASYTGYKGKRRILNLFWAVSIIGASPKEDDLEGVKEHLF